MVHSGKIGRKTRRAVSAILVSMLLASVAAPAAFAGKPLTSPSVDEPITIEGVCAHDVSLTNKSFQGNDSLFDPKRDGSQRGMSRGTAVSLVTDLATRATYPARGGYHFTFTTAADGSARVDATGANIFAWYFPGDVSDLGPGLWDVSGHATEWYAADGSFIRATFSGHATDVCAALGG